MLLCCELCQAVHVHRRYTDRLWPYRHGLDITEYAALQIYTAREGLQFQLDWEVSRDFETGNGARIGSRICVHLNQLTVLSV
jgi:hypothetical protein